MRKRNLRKRKRRTQGTKKDIKKKKRGIIRKGKLKERQRRGRRAGGGKGLGLTLKKFLKYCV